jgi:hypothetical protein
VWERLQRSGEIEADAAVDGDAALAGGVDDHRVEVELDHLGDELDQRRDPLQDVGEGGAVGRGRAAEAVEQLAAAELVEHVGGVEVADRGDESLDRLKVSTADGFVLSTGKRVRIDATVWAYSSYWFDSLDLYYAADASNPTWLHLGTLTPFQVGAQTLSTTYVLPSGPVQAIRGQYRYAGARAPGVCESDPFDDRDDLVFVVQP